MNRFIVAAVLAAVTLSYYFFRGGIPEILHILDHAILHEYVPFIVLLFSLYTISGGIRIQGDLPAHPFTNSVFIAIGGGLASFIGTTGAAMLLIRPLIETNIERKHIQHTVIFFIFVVCNCGGCLLPIGDPPLFLGYLKGVRFFWPMEALWQPWLLVNGLLIGIYYVLDHFFYYPKETKSDIQRDEALVRPLQISGLMPNLLLLAGVIVAVALLDPTKPISFFNDWRPWPFLREIVQIALVALSLTLGSHELRVRNRFNYHAIVEVGAIFIGIFICMQPALAILDEKGPELPVNESKEFFWAAGSLSAVLDNAPTYVVFFETANSKFLAKRPADGNSFIKSVDVKGSIERQWLVAISLGSVFLGAMTYIGNGPNFMVRAIAEQMGVRMPSFFGYVLRYSLIYLLPVFWIATWVFM